ncbi:MAG: zinc-dependent peptidase [Pseudomonadales bacterium]|nr:zinc-dependent peptidase [Pseudomonadales bacterium]
MTALYILLSLVLLVGGFIAYPRWRDKRILRGPFPASWQPILERRLPFFSKLSESERSQLQRMIRLFVAKKRFYGCGGLELNDEIRITVAAEACLLLLNRNSSLYSGLQHILIYPSAFRVNRQWHQADGIVSQEHQGLLGESWSHGKVILSWDDVEAGIENFHDGHNVALHEFSHQLDSESGTANGAPLLEKNSYQTWAQVLSAEFAKLTDSLEHGHASLMDTYGATNPAEFFAVATEVFFEKPLQMAEKHPALFAELSLYYRVDPRQWQ